MIVTYIRSSSAGTFYTCSHKYLLDYCLGLPNLPNQKASYGSAFHKAAEIRGRLKLAIQNNLDYVDCEELGTFALDEVTDEFSIIKGFETYKGLEQPQWGDKELGIIRKIYYDAMAYMNGAYNPMNQNLIEVERKFDFQLIQDRFRYNYSLPSGEELSGYLGLKGTIDVVGRAHNGQLIVVDYKTGENRKDINTGKLKEWEDFNKDFQILLYMYVILTEFPDEPAVSFTMFFTRAGGPFTILKERDDLPEIEDRIYEKFCKIRETKTPPLRRYDWFCQYVCSHNKLKIGNKSTCQHYLDEVKQYGVDAVTERNSINKAYLRYMSGGGRSEKTETLPP